MKQTRESLEARLQELQQEHAVLEQQHAAHALRVAEGEAAAATDLNEVVQAMTANQAGQQAMQAAFQAVAMRDLQEETEREIESLRDCLNEATHLIGKRVGKEARLVAAAKAARVAWDEYQAARNAEERVLERLKPYDEPSKFGHQDNVTRWPTVQSAPEFSADIKRFAGSAEPPKVDGAIAHASTLHARRVAQVKRDLAAKTGKKAA